MGETLTERVAIRYEHVVAGVEAVQKAHKNVAMGLKEIDSSAKAAAGAENTLERAQKGLAAIGIRTTESVKAEIASLELLRGEMGKDAFAAQQLDAQIRGLKGALDQSAGGFKKQGAESHRASLFLLNFSRGMEDLKFGLPAVVNNLDSIGFSFSLLKKEIGEGQSAFKAIMSNLMTPAGVLAGLNAIYTAWVLISKAMGDAKEESDALNNSLGDLVSVSNAGLFGNVKVDLEDARRLSEEYTAKLAILERQQTDMELKPRYFSAEDIRSVRDAIDQLEVLKEKIDDQVRTQDALTTAARVAVENGLDPLAHASREVAMAGDDLIGMLAAAGIEADTASAKFLDTAEALAEVRKLQVEAAKDRAGEIGVMKFVGPVGMVPVTRDPELDDADIDLGGTKRLETDRDRARKAAEAAWKRSLAAGDTLIKSLEKENVKLAEQEALAHQIANYRSGHNFTAVFEGSSLDELLGTASELEGGLSAVILKTDALETSADRIAKAFRDGLNQEIEGTAIALEQWPLDVVDGLSATISESAYDLLTLQGGFKDFGNDVLNIMKRQVAEMAAMIVKQKLLNALKKREGAMSGLSNIGGIFGGLAGLGGGTLLPLAGIAAAMYGVASIGRSSHKGSQVGSFRDRPQNRIQLQAATLPSGDVRFAANESNMRISRLGA